MKGISYYRDAQAAGVSLPPEFIDKVLGTPKCSVEQASYNAVALEQDRVATELERLRAEVAAWRTRFPNLAYHGGQLLRTSASDAWGPR